MTVLLWHSPKSCETFLFSSTVAYNSEFVSPFGSLFSHTVSPLSSRILCESTGMSGRLLFAVAETLQPWHGMLVTSHTDEQSHNAKNLTQGKFYSIIKVLVSTLCKNGTINSFILYDAQAVIISSSCVKDTDDSSMPCSISVK